MPNVTLSAFNTISVAAASGVYRLTFTPPGFARKVDIMNTGAGAISLSVADPTVNGAATLQIPANWAINGLTVDGTTGIGVIAAADTTISVRMT